MKEATGELNASVIVFIAVSLLAAFFFMILWPNIKSNLKKTSSCSSAVCSASDGKVYYNKNGESTCHSPNDASKTFQCPFRN